MTTIREIESYLQSIAPPETAEEWDNVGLLVGAPAAGAPAAAVTDALVCLDITHAAVTAAKEAGAQLIVSHHPVIFRPLRRLPGGSVPYALAQAGIAALCMHTNLDKAPGGVGETLARALGLQELRTAPDGFTVVGRLPRPLSPEAFVRLVGERLHTAVRYRPGEREVSLVGVAGGAGGEFLLPALEAFPLDGFVTGEMRHHEWLDLPGVTAVDAGHYATEVVIVPALAGRLAARFPEVRFHPFEDTPPYQTLA